MRKRCAYACAFLWKFTQLWIPQISEPRVKINTSAQGFFFRCGCMPSSFLSLSLHAPRAIIEIDRFWILDFGIGGIGRMGRMFGSAV